MSIEEMLEKMVGQLASIVGILETAFPEKKSRIVDGEPREILAPLYSYKEKADRFDEMERQLKKEQDLNRSLASEVARLLKRLSLTEALKEGTSTNTVGNKSKIEYQNNE